MIQREKRTGKILIRAFLGFDYSFFSLRCSSSALKTTRAPSAFFVFFFLFFFVPRTLSLIFVGKELFNGEKFIINRIGIPPKNNPRDVPS